jgi:formylmethanofuran:tetrahydromethanopterin formyltransferase
MEAIISIIFIVASVIVLDTLTYKSFQEALKEKIKLNKKIPGKRKLSAREYQTH